MNKAELHTPEELLDAAESLFRLEKPQFMRAVILEAISALETLVHTQVFKMLKAKTDEKLVDLIEEKINSDFDVHMGVLLPLAFDVEIDKSADLWRQLKEAKKLRNKIIHEGRKVTREDAKKVLEVTYEWLSQFSLAVELIVALKQFKSHIEENEELVISHREDASILVIEFFGKNKPASEASLPGNNIKDLFLKFGNYTVAFEIMFARPTQSATEKIKGAVDRAAILIKEGAYATHAVVIVFVNCKDKNVPQDIMSFRKETVNLIFVGLQNFDNLLSSIQE